MDPLFDEVSRILAQPRPRRSTLRLVVATAAGAAAAVLPGHAFAWGSNKCGTATCGANEMCCNAATSTCCAYGKCLKNVAGEPVCCPTGNACGGLCCSSAQT